MGNKVDRTRLSPVVSCGRMKSNEHKRKYMKFYLNTEKRFYFCVGGQRWEQITEDLWSVVEIQNMTTLVDLALTTVWSARWPPEVQSNLNHSLIWGNAESKKKRKKKWLWMHRVSLQKKYHIPWWKCFTLFCNKLSLKLSKNIKMIVDYKKNTSKNSFEEIQSGPFDI